MANPPNFDSLQANLREIYAALQNANGDALPLYAYNKSVVIYRGCLSGKLWQKWDQGYRLIESSKPPVLKDVLKTVLNVIFNHAVHTAYKGRQKRIWHHMRQIDCIFGKTLTPQENADQRKRYVAHLTEELKGSVDLRSAKAIALQDFDRRTVDPMTEAEETEHRHMVIRFFQATMIFWRMFIKDDDIPLRQPLLPFLDKQSLLTDRIIYKALKKEGRWTQVEGIMQQTIPVELIAKLEDPDNLTVEEKRRLKSWVRTLNEQRGKISLKLLSAVLKEILVIIQMQGSSALTMPDFLYWLDQQGCEILHGEDGAHMDWREALRSGHEITCNGKKLVLGEQLSPEKEIDDEFKVFELKNHPDWVVKIANNRFRLLIEERKAQNEDEHWGFRLVETVDNIEEDAQKPPVRGLDKEGRCVVLEKLSNPLGDYEWTSTEARLEEEDEKVALVFANHLFCLYQWKANAEKLSLNHLLFDRSGVLKSVRLLKKGEPNYNEWEAHCFAASKDNPYVLAYLIQASKLSEHKVAAYYRAAVAHALKTGETDLLSRPLPMGHRQGCYDKRIKELCAEALELRRVCLKRVTAMLRKKGENASDQEEELSQKIGERLVYFYKESSTPGILSSDPLQKQVLETFETSDWEEPVLDDSDITDYYQEQHEQMMKNNDAAGNGAKSSPPPPKKKEKK